jgi:hypothetical protein
MSHPMPVLESFADAVSAALGLHHLLWRSHVMIGLDLHGSVLDLTAPGDAHTVESALDWARELALVEHRLQWLVLLSAVGDDPLSELRERDLVLFRQAQKSFRAQHVEWRDWILTNGSELRSMAFTCSTDDAWH